MNLFHKLFFLHQMLKIDVKMIMEDSKNPVFKKLFYFLFICILA